MFPPLTRHLKLEGSLSSHLKLVSESQTKVMKLSSISLIATTLAAIAGSVNAAPAAPRSKLQNLVERDVDIYSRGLAAHKHYYGDDRDKSRDAAIEHKHGENLQWRASGWAHAAGRPDVASYHDGAMKLSAKSYNTHKANENGPAGTPFSAGSERFHAGTQKMAHETIRNSREILGRKT